MRILVTNDDGPPSPVSSPYIQPFVSHLHAAGHTVSVVIPHQQRSWISKAHLVGQPVTATPYTPPAPTHPSPGPRSTSQPVPVPDPTWYTATSTPASCTQLGLHHLFPPSTSSQPPSDPSSSTTSSSSPFDLVISGPNYGRNTTALFALSSGTLGGALEAAVAGSRAIALSFAFFPGPRKDDPAVVAEACAHAVRVVEHLAANGDWNADWPVPSSGSGGEGEGSANRGGVVYTVNVPLLEGVGGWETVWTEMLGNRWGSSCFVELEGDGQEGGSEKEVRRAEGHGGREEGDAAREGQVVDGQRHFRWAPKFTDVYESVKRAGPGSDGWAVAHEQTSVTMIRANFMQHLSPRGVLKL